MKPARKFALPAVLATALLFAACSTKEGGEVTPPTYTVTYHANGADSGTVPVDPARYEFGQTVAVPGNTGNLAKARYVFAGWCLTADGTGTAYLPGQTFSMRSGNMTLYAKWAPVYAVAYDGNGNTGGSVPVDSALYREGAEVTVLGNTGGLSKLTGGIAQVWAGWNTRADGGGTTYAAGGTFSMGSADAVLYAVWLPPYVLPDAAVDVSLGARSVLVDGTRAYVIEGLDFKVLDVADPLVPSVLGTVTHGYTDLRVEAHAISAGVVWCVRSSSGGYGAATHVFGVDVSDPANPALRGSLTLQGSSSLLTQSSLIHAGYWLVHDYSRNVIYVVDISDPGAPAVFGSWGVPNMVNGGPGIMMIEGDLLYLPCGENGTLRIYDLSDLSAVYEMGAVAMGAESYGTAVKIGPYVYATAAAYVRVIDVSDPAHPAIVGTAQADGYLKGRKGRLFAVGLGSPPQLYAYSLAVPTAPALESSVTLPVPAPSTALYLGPMALPMATWVGDYLLGMTYGSAASHHGLRALLFIVN